jgi:hypothetical protein
MNMRTVVFGLVSALLVALPALASDGGDAVLVANATTPSPSGAASTASASASANTGVVVNDDDDVGVAKDETPEHRTKRRSYIRRAKKAFDEQVHAGGKQLTDDEREAVRKHWRRSMRLWRIRHLAEADGDKATIAKVDSLLSKADEQTRAELKRLNEAAPSSTGGSK